jgi:hypothetical protein
MKYFYLVTGLRIRIIKTALKLIACFLYVVRVVLDNGPAYANWYDFSSF